MKIRIPAQTVNVDPDAWAHEYGIDRADVRKDVMAYFAHIAQEQIDVLGLEVKEPGVTKV
jgi:hypothetical protein